MQAQVLPPLPLPRQMSLSLEPLECAQGQATPASKRLLNPRCWFDFAAARSAGPHGERRSLSRTLSLSSSRVSNPRRPTSCPAPSKARLRFQHAGQPRSGLPHAGPPRGPGVAGPTACSRHLRPSSASRHARRSPSMPPKCSTADASDKAIRHEQPSGRHCAGCSPASPRSHAPAATVSRCVPSNEGALLCAKRVL
jgi:hypothetical protein